MSRKRKVPHNMKRMKGGRYTPPKRRGGGQ